MHLIKRAMPWRMLGFGFGGGESGDHDSDKENQAESPPLESPPWVKRQRVNQEDLVSSPEPNGNLLSVFQPKEVQETSHANLVKSIRYVPAPFSLKIKYTVFVLFQ